MGRPRLTYQKAGVDDAAAEKLVSFIARRAKDTLSANVVSGIGPFAALYRLPTAYRRRPLLVSSCDGVGTKVLLADDLGQYGGLGQDLVAMNVNDVATTGARLLFFLDYLAVGRLIPRRDRQILDGIARACAEAGCALIGGETAQMPSVYGKTGFDLAGFAVGIVEEDKVIGPRRVRAGDLLVGISSSGLHSNGFSLVRRIFSGGRRRMLRSFSAELKTTLGEALLTPTLIYSGIVHRLARRAAVVAAAHITGGGIPGNLIRIIPAGLRADVRKGSWCVPPVFSIVQRCGAISEGEMYRVFNMGLGMILACRPIDESRVLAAAAKAGRTAAVVGEVRRGTRGVSPGNTAASSLRPGRRSGIPARA